jgi:transposase
MSQKRDTPAVIGVDFGKNSFHIVDQNRRCAIVLRQKWARGQVEARLANLPPCQIGIDARLCRRASPQSHAKGTWSRRAADAG